MPVSKSKALTLLTLVYSSWSLFEVLYDFSDFLTDLALQSDKVIIADDFSIDVDVDSDSHSSCFTTLLF